MARERFQRIGGQAQRLRNQHRQRLLDRYERVSEPILLVAAFAMVPLVVGSISWDLSSSETKAFAATGGAIWVIFAVDLASKLILAPSAKLFLRRHWLEAAIVAVPFVRPLYLLRLFLFGSRAIVGLRKVAEADFVLALTSGLVIVCATVLYSVETNNPQLDSFGDALWWGAVTVTTVGYGDIFPSTTLGRLVAIVLMVGGITLFGAVAGNVVALLSKIRGPSNTSPAASDGQLAASIDALRLEVARLEARLSSDPDSAADR